MDMIILEKLVVKVKLGVEAWERLLPQSVVFDITFHKDLNLPSVSDEIDHTIDYGTVALTIQKALHEKEFHLLEALAEYICSVLMQAFSPTELTVKVSKPCVLRNMSSASIVLNRKASS